MDASAPYTVSADTVAPGRMRLGLHGRVTVANANELKLAIGTLVARSEDVTIDCSEVEYLDASAVQLLMCLGNELVRCGRTAALTGVAPGLATDFRLLGLGAAFFTPAAENSVGPKT